MIKQTLMHLLNTAESHWLELKDSCPGCPTLIHGVVSSLHHQKLLKTKSARVGASAFSCYDAMMQMLSVPNAHVFKD